MFTGGTAPWIAATYLFASAVALLIDVRRPASKWQLHTLLWINFLGASGFVLFITRFQSFFIDHNPLGQSRAELFIIILLVAQFSLVVEIPGFLLNSWHDRVTVSVIDKVRDAALDLRLNPTLGTSQLEGLLSTHREQLRDLAVGSTLEKLVGFFKRMENVDIPLLETALAEIRRTRESVEARSKHPLPALIQFFGLSGLVFVLAEILAALRGK
jgi:hypothetical protein